MRKSLPYYTAERKRGATAVSADVKVSKRFVPHNTTAPLPAYEKEGCHETSISAALLTSAGRVSLAAYG